MGFSHPFSGERDLFGLAPGGVYLATLIAQGTGELLPHPFTLTHQGSRLEVRSLKFGVKSNKTHNSPLITQNSPQSGAGGILSVALSLPCEIGARKLISLVKEAVKCLPLKN